ncbi:MAG: hypothetical protein NUV94_06935 [Candidatus Acetothermia bacterium]|nr:hypothetical protein [Candidatus Acetothermia bacterium]
MAYPGGCAFHGRAERFLNVFQTAQILRHGDVAFTVGMAVLDLAPAVLTPQGRFAVGLSDGVEFGVQAGGMVNPGTGWVERDQRMGASGLPLP